VVTYPFEDHNAPPVQLIVDCCNDVHDWLTKEEKNIVGINCKAGKGRTGLIICCYLMHAGICKNADDAMLFYGTRRTKDGKGVTIASQKRYVRYYEQVLKLGRVPDPKMLKIKKITVNTIPNFSGDPCATVIIKNKEVGSTQSIKIPKGATSYDIPADIPIIGDIKVQMDMKKGKSIQHTCHFWFNTGFVGSDNKLHFDKSEIDVASKDKKNAHFKPEFSIDVEFEDVEVDTSSMTNGVASPRRDGVKKDKKDKKDKSSKKDKKGKGKEDSEEADDSVEVVKSPKKDKKKDKGKEKDAKEAAKTEDKPVTSPKSEEKSKDKKDKKSKSSDPAAPEPTAPASDSAFAPPSSSTTDDDFGAKRKRRQSFYELDEELENNPDLSESAIEEMELEEYFEPESVDEEDGKEDAAEDSPKTKPAKSSDKASSDSSDTEPEKKPAKKGDDSSESSQVSNPKDKSDSGDKGSSKSIAISATSSSSRRGLNSPATSPVEKPAKSVDADEAKDEPKDTPKSKKDKKDKESSKGDKESKGSDSPSTKSKKKKSAEN
jgi:hypothetical protein